MKTPTRHAPHICCHVFFQIALSCSPLTPSSNAMMIQETRIAVPPTAGLKSNAAEMVAPDATDDCAVTAAWNQLTAGRDDHDDQDDDRQPALKDLAGRQPMRIRGKLASWRELAAIAHHSPRAPDFQKKEKRAEANNRSGHVRQIRTE